MKYTSTDIQIKLETAVLTACRQSLPLDNLEVDAIICVNVADRKEEHVVKIHQRFDMSGPPNRNFIKVTDMQQNNCTGMAVDKSEVEMYSNDAVAENDLGKRNVQTVHPPLLNKQKVPKESNEKTDVNSKANSVSGRSPSKHPRKSSTPRCLNPKLRQINLNNVLGPLTEKNGEVSHDFRRSKSSLLKSNNVYRVTNYGKEISHGMDTGTISDTKDEMPSAKRGNSYIKIEPPECFIDRNSAKYEGVSEDDDDSLMPKEKKSDTGNDCVNKLSCSDNDFTIEVNSDSESYDTTYNYTFDKTMEEGLEENTLVIMKSLDESDDQSLGSSPSDLTNSMMSYNVSHIIPAGTISESNDILDIPNYRQSHVLEKSSQMKQRAGGKWNDLTSKKCTNIPSSVEKLSCRMCGAMFSSTRTRRRHETSTCGATRFSCIVCSKLFSRKDARRRHMMRMHPLYLIETSRGSGNSIESLKA